MHFDARLGAYGDATANPIGLDFNGSIGLPLPSTDVSVRDDAGSEVPTNAVGEICVFGPQVMGGYWNRPDETEKVMFGDWLRTGDIGRIDAKGFVFIEDRKKDMILVSQRLIPASWKSRPSQKRMRTRARWSRYSR
jgi:long-chain acyl-CoA synthetase